MTPLAENPTQRPWNYIENGVPIYRAYVIGDCIRSQVACRVGESAYPPGKWLQDAMDASSEFESVALDRYEERTGHSIIWSQKSVERCVEGVIDEEGKQDGCMALIRGHLDGLDQLSDDVLEVKSLSPNNFALYNSGGLTALKSLGVKYLWQGAFYGHATNRNVRWVIYNKGASDADRESGDDLIISPPMDPELLIPWADIEARVRLIEDYASRDELPDCDRNCRPGDPFEEVHEFENEYGAVADDELVGHLRELWVIKCLLEGDPEVDGDTGLLGRKEELSNLVKGQWKPGKYAAGMYSGQIIRSKSTKFDKRKLAKDRPEIVEEYTYPGPDIIKLIVKKTKGAISE